MLIYLVTLLLVLLISLVQGGTLAAVKCIDGIAIAADSLDTSGPYVTSRNTKKVHALTDSIVMCCANDAMSEFCSIFDEVKEFIKNRKLVCGETTNMESISSVIRRLVNSKYRAAHIVLAGCENDQESPDLSDKSKLHLCEILPKGSRIESDLVVTGTAAHMVAPIVEECILPGHCSVNDAVSALKKAVLKAMNSDHSSGGKMPRVWTLQRL